MQIYSETGDFRLYQGSMLDMLQVIAPNSIDAVLTDPPYELGFMGKGWDNSGIAFQPDTWRKCYSVLKSGGYLLAFGGTRTFHRIACAIEDAGFEIRDTIMWLYGSGFPKSMNIGLAIDKKNGVESEIVGYTSQQDIRSGNYTGVCTNNNEYSRVDWPIKKASNEWAGWGTALKPAYEPVIVARKPCEGSCVDNVMRYGVGGLNIDGCRVGDDLIKGGTMPDFRDVGRQQKEISGVDKLSFGQITNAERKPLADHVGRYPSNVILTYDDTDFDEVCGGMPETKSTQAQGIHRNNRNGNTVFSNTSCGFNNSRYDSRKLEGFDDEGSAARYFYCAKASKRDRDEGLDAFQEKQTTDGSLRCNADTARMFGANSTLHRNTHPTVKPVDLMQYLVRLVTPKGGTVLDPFNGSGSTGKAVMYENRDRNSGYKYIGIELTAEYLPIADARIRYAAGDHSPVEPAEQPLTGQVTFFDLLGGAE